MDCVTSEKVGHNVNIEIVGLNFSGFQENRKFFCEYKHLSLIWGWA